MYVAKSAQGICRISFPYATDEDFYQSVLKDTFPCSKHVEANIKVQRNNAALKCEIAILKQYFQGKQVDFDFPLDLSGSTTFQKWYGRNCGKFRMVKAVHKWVAEQIRHPLLPAVVWLIIEPFAACHPRHRVIGSNGSLTGYAWAAYQKYLLEMEKGISNGIAHKHAKQTKIIFLSCSFLYFAGE